MQPIDSIRVQGNLPNGVVYLKDHWIYEHGYIAHYSGTSDMSFVYTSLAIQDVHLVRSYHYGSGYVYMLETVNYELAHLYPTMSLS